MCLITALPALYNILDDNTVKYIGVFLQYFCATQL